MTIQPQQGRWHEHLMRFSIYLSIAGLTPVLGCSAPAPDQGVGTYSGAVKSAPADNGVPVAVDKARPAFVIKRSSERRIRATPDQAEVLNGTFKTVGSRRMLLEMVRKSSSDDRSALLGIYNNVTATLSAEDRAVAVHELNTTLGGQ